MIPFKFDTLFGADLIKNFSEFSPFQLFGAKDLSDIQRKNLEAVSDAGKIVLEGIQTAVKHQTDFFSQTLKESTSLVNEITGQGTLEQKVARQAALVQKYYEQSVVNWDELAEITRKSSEGAANILHGRVTSSLAEFKSTLNKKTGSEKSNIPKKAA